MQPPPSDSGSDSDGAGLDEEQQWGTWEEEEAEEEEPTPSLFEPTKLLPSPMAALRHDAQHHGFDLCAYAAQVRLAMHPLACLHAHAWQQII